MDLNIRIASSKKVYLCPKSVKWLPSRLGVRDSKVHKKICLFAGTIIHSHDFREPDRYKGRRVLVVGAGPSGMDIGIDVGEVSKALIHSHHSKVGFRTKFPEHFVKKPDVKEFNETGVTFVDGSYEEIDDVILCTGSLIYSCFFTLLHIKKDLSTVFIVTSISISIIHHHLGARA